MVAINSHLAFSHAIKCGGTSMASVLGGTSKAFPMHPPSQCLKAAIPGKPIIGFIRDPWLRMVSLFEFVARKPPGGPHDLHRYDLTWNKREGFRRWLLTGADYIDSDPICSNWFEWRTRQYVRRSEMEWPGLEVYMQNGLPPIQQRPAMWWHQEADYIGKLEHAQGDLNEACRLFGHPLVTIPYRNVNRTRTQDWRKLYDAETIAFVAKFHADDIKVGGYEWVTD